MAISQTGHKTSFSRILAPSLTSCSPRPGHQRVVKKGAGARVYEAFYDRSTMRVGEKAKPVINSFAPVVIEHH